MDLMGLTEHGYLKVDAFAERLRTKPQAAVTEPFSVDHFVNLEAYVPMRATLHAADAGYIAPEVSPDNSHRCYHTKRASGRFHYLGAIRHYNLNRL